MCRLWTVPAVLLIWGPISQSAPQLRPTSSGYFPTTVGDKRVLELPTPDGKVERVEVVVAAKEKGGGVIVTTRPECVDSVFPENQFEVSNHGIAALVIGGTPLRNPVFHLRLPAKAGETWVAEEQVVGDVVFSRQTFTTGPEEEVEVPAGKFRAIRVDVTTPHGASSSWYAPGVGLVKTVRKTSDGREGEPIQALRSFVPANRQ
jgi:hypothetical protein